MTGAPTGLPKIYSRGNDGVGHILTPLDSENVCR